MILSNEYSAGLFDGEGWFTIRAASGKRYRMKREFAFQLRAALAMREKSLITALQETFGGSVREKISTNPKHSNYYYWELCGNGCLDFASKLLPYLKAKRKQAEIAIAFQTTKQTLGNKALTDEEYWWYERLHRQMKKSNQKGVGKD